MTFWQTPSFKALQRAWYQRLKDEGFQDAEEMIGSELVLTQSANHPYKDADDLQRTAKESYFRLVAQLVHETVFQTAVDRIIMTMFADGARMKEIVAALERRIPPCFIERRRCRMTVRMTIRRYEMEWGIREYSPRQLNKREAS